MDLVKTLNNTPCTRFLNIEDLTEKQKYKILDAEKKNSKYYDIPQIKITIKIDAYNNGTLYLPNRYSRLINTDEKLEELKNIYIIYEGKVMMGEKAFNKLTFST